MWANSLGHGRREGSFPEYVVVPAERCYRLPSGVDPERAVAVAHSEAPAYPGWFVHVGLRPGEVAYVGGGAGNLGSAAIAMARRAGARVLASARPAGHERCREAGADVVVDYRAPDLWCRLREAAPEGVDLFWETSGHHDFDLARRVLAPGSRILLSAASEDPRPLPVRELYISNVSLRGFVISQATVPQLAHAARLVSDMLLAGELVGQISEILPLPATPAVHGRFDAGTVTGPLLLRP